MTNLIDKKCDDSCNLEFLKPKYRPFVILFLLLHNTLTINLKEDGDVPTKPYQTQRDLSLAYSPGVAEPCLEIQKNPDTAYDYTDKGNLVAVISNGTAVLGLGDIGAMSGKPVMDRHSEASTWKTSKHLSASKSNNG